MEGGNKFAEKGQQIEARGVEDSSKLQDTGSNAVGEEKSAEGDGGAAFKRKDGGAKGYKEDEEGEVKAEALDHKDVANP